MAYSYLKKKKQHQFVLEKNKLQVEVKTYI